MTEQYGFSPPEGYTPAQWAMFLLSSDVPRQAEAGEAWVLSHPDEAHDELVRMLEEGPRPTTAAMLLGVIGREESVPALVAAHRRGGELLRDAAAEALRRNPSPAAARARAELKIDDG